MQRRDSSIIRLTQVKAVFISPPSTAKNTAIGRVWVFPAILPAIIRVAPNSPRVREKDRTVPAISPGRLRGSRIFMKMVRLDRPKVRATSITVLSTCSNAPLAVLYINGKATTLPEITVADHLKIIFMPMFFNNCPKGLLFPNSIRRKKPRTVGGRIIGNVKSVSIIPLVLGGRFITHQAAAMPRKNTMAVETRRLQALLARHLCRENHLKFQFLDKLSLY